jgi:hypothetical protein
MEKFQFEYRKPINQTLWEFDLLTDIVVFLRLQ